MFFVGGVARRKPWCRGKRGREEEEGKSLA